MINRLRAVLLRHGIADARRLALSADDRWLETFALPPRAAASVRGLRPLLAGIRTQTQQRTAEVTQVAAQDPIATGLQQVRGIGPVLALTIRAEVGDIRRVATPGQLASDAGLVPSIDASARPYRSGRITRRGSPLAAVGAGRSGGARPTTPGSHWTMGPRLGAAERGAQSARRARARACGEIHRLWSGIN